MKNILITGVNGFVGRFLASVLVNAGYFVRGSLREPETADSVYASVAVGEIHADTDWSGALHGIDCVVHLAGRVHVMDENGIEALTAFRKVNVHGAASLARQAAAGGVKRFIYLSSIKVNGERTTVQPFHPEDPVYPEDPYAQSKWEAEQTLQAIGAETGMEIVIIRPPLIYGPGAKSNLFRLMRLINKRWPLPLGSIRNARSLVGIDNLCDLIRICIEHPQAAGEIFLAADGDDLSTPQLLRILADALQKPLLLLPVPVAVLIGLGKLLRMTGAIERLTGDLRVDIRKNQDLLGWTPPFPVADGLRNMVEAYKKHSTS